MVKKIEILNTQIPRRFNQGTTTEKKKYLRKGKEYNKAIGKDGRTIWKRIEASRRSNKKLAFEKNNKNIKYIDVYS